MALPREWVEESDPIEPPVRHLTVVAPAAPRPVRTGRSIEVRRAARARMLRRRRRSALVLAGIVTLLVLAFPGHAFGGEFGSPRAMDSIDSGSLAGTTYVVRAGDTVGSIARLVDPTDPAAARRAIVAEIGSSTVLVGEHVRLP